MSQRDGECGLTGDAGAHDDLIDITAEDAKELLDYLCGMLVEKFGYEKWMFEASDPPVFKWYLKTFGKDVNLFIDHSQIVEFTAWRTGLWGDPAIWKGKKLSYP